MKNFRIKFQILLTIISLFGVHDAFAQDKSRYISSVYKVAFQTPEGTTKNARSTDERTFYDAVESKSQLKPRLEFAAISDRLATAKLSQQLGTAEGLEQFVAGAVSGFKAEIKGAEITVTEKKRIQLAGLNAVKFVASASISDIKMRFASYTVVVPEHKRMYTFIVLAVNDDFDRWLTIAEKSVYSFALLKTAHK